MGAETHEIRVAEVRRFKHPVYPEIEKHYMIVRACDLPDGMRKDANARDGKGTDLRKQAYRDVQKSLMADNETWPGIFDLKNKGIVILADSVRKVEDDLYEIAISEGQGIVDGGHTYDIITKARTERDIPDDQYVDIQIRTGVPDDMITDISSGLNTGVAVKRHSIDNLADKYKMIKNEISSEPYAGLIAWRESDDGDYDVRDLICVMEMMNVIDFPNGGGSHPVSAYSGRDAVTKKFSAAVDPDKPNSTYHRLLPILKDALVLYDTIRAKFRDIYNDAGLGNAGGLDIIEKARKKSKHSFPFAGLPGAEWQLRKGALYPIFAAFRNKVRINPHTDLVEWDGGFDSVLDLWETTGVELVKETQAAVKDINRKPEILGKNRGHWNNLYKTVEIQILRDRNPPGA